MYQFSNSPIHQFTNLPIEFDFAFFIITTYISSNIYILSISFFSYFLNQLTNSIHYPLLSSLSLTIYILNTTYLFLHEIRDTYLNFVYSISYCMLRFNLISYCILCQRNQDSGVGAQWIVPFFLYIFPFTLGTMHRAPTIFQTCNL